MRSFIAFLKKELMESTRSGRLIFFLILCFAFGIMNPAVAKLTPWLLEALSDSLAESGMSITAVTVDALTSWTQFFKNIPMALIAFVLMYGNILTREYESGTLILILTKGLSRAKVVLAKLAMMLGIWTVGYWLCFAVTYGYNDYFWTNDIAQNLLAATVYWWVFGVFTICLTLFFSVLLKSYSGVLLATGATVLLSYLIGLLPKIKDFVPTALMSGNAIVLGAKSGHDCLTALIITASLCVICVVSSIPIINKKAL